MAQRKVDFHFASALRTLELQASATFADFISHDSLAVIAADCDLCWFCCDNRGCHIKPLLSWLELL